MNSQLSQQERGATNREMSSKGTLWLTLTSQIKSPNIYFSLCLFLVFSLVSLFLDLLVWTSFFFPLIFSYRGSTWGTSGSLKQLQLLSSLHLTALGLIHRYRTKQTSTQQREPHFNSSTQMHLIQSQFHAVKEFRHSWWGGGHTGTLVVLSYTLLAHR